MSASEQVNLREYEYLEYSRLGEDGARHLERATSSLGIPVFRFFRERAQAQQYVGVLQTGSHTVQILPKIHEQEEENLGYLLSLLGFVRRLKLRSNDLSDFEKLGGSFLEILIRHFATELNRLLRTRYVHRYVEVENRTSFLRGKPLAERERDGTAKLYARYACRYEVFTPDHPLNRVLKFCNGLLLRQTKSTVNRKTLHENDVLLSEVSRVTVTKENVDRIHLDRLNRHYEPVLELCRLLLSNSTLDLRTGRITQLAFVFDMNVLFEEFVARFLELHKERLEIGGESLIRVEAQRRLGKLFGKFVMRVDVVLHDGTGRRFLVDTKYKVLDAGKDHAGLSQTDFYQMYAYANAGEGDYDGVILLYPSTAAVMPERTHFTHGPVQLYVRRFDPKTFYKSEHRTVDTEAVIEQFNLAFAGITVPTAQTRTKVAAEIG